jgi:hypothetical protein
LDTAGDAYGKAADLRRTLAQPHLEMEVLAGLIRVDLIRRELARANHKAQMLFTYLQSNRLLGVEEPARVYCTCALALLNEEHARKTLNDARRMIEERAAAIDDLTLRDSFLQIAAHRATMQAWRDEGRRSIS